MRKEDFDDFRMLLQGVHDFYSKDLSRFAMDIWWKAMAPYDLQVVSRALSMHCTNPDAGQFCPKPADVVRMVGGTTKDAAIMAWNKVQAAVSSVGSYRSVCFDDPIINRVLLDLGGWPAMCSKPANEIQFVEKNFCDRYRVYKTHGDTAHPQYLVGITEADNKSRGFKSQPPMLIGNREEARRVMESGSHNPMIGVSVGSFLPALTVAA